MSQTEEEVKIVLVFSGPKDSVRERLRKICEFGRTELGWELEERHVFKPWILLAWIDPTLAPAPPLAPHRPISGSIA
jgi:hypothetical protein